MDKPTKRPRGRPCLYTNELAEEICRRLSAGESLLQICKGEEMPADSTVRLWVLDDHEGFAAKYTRARQLQAERWAEEVLSLSDQPVPTTDHGATDSGAVQKQRLQVDSRKWLLSKVLPKIYGDKLDLKHSGSVGLSINIDLGKK